MTNSDEIDNLIEKYLLTRLNVRRITFQEYLDAMHSGQSHAVYLLDHRRNGWLVGNTFYLRLFTGEGLTSNCFKWEIE